MKVIVMKKGSLDVTQYNGVTNIALAGGTITITYGTSNTASYTYADYMVQIIP